MQIHVASSLFDGLAFLAKTVELHGVRKSDMWEAQDIFLECDLHSDDLDKFAIFCASLSKIPPFDKGYAKSVRAYQQQSGSIVKPSYLGRIRSFEFKKIGSNDPEGIDQIANIAEKFLSMPQASNLQISIFHPQDLLDQFRPGYVPCLSFMDIKYRAGELRIKPYFRSCDVAEVAPFDLLNLCKLAFEIVREIQGVNTKVRFDRIKMVFMFSRIFAYKRKLHHLRYLV